MLFLVIQCYLESLHRLSFFFFESPAPSPRNFELRFSALSFFFFFFSLFFSVVSVTNAPLCFIGLNSCYMCATFLHLPALANRYASSFSLLNLTPFPFSISRRFAFLFYFILFCRVELLFFFSPAFTATTTTKKRENNNSTSNNTRCAVTSLFDFLSFIGTRETSLKRKKTERASEACFIDSFFFFFATTHRRNDVRC